MKMSEIQNLDPNNIGSWPGPAKGVAIAVLCAAVLGAGYYFDTQAQLDEFDSHVRKERELKDVFEAKQRKAANLEPLKRQLREMEQSFGALLRLLPNRTEIEGLLVDISKSGLAAGLGDLLGLQMLEHLAAEDEVRPRQGGRDDVDAGEEPPRGVAMTRLVAPHDGVHHVVPEIGPAADQREHAGRVAAPRIRHGLIVHRVDHDLDLLT